VFLEDLNLVFRFQKTARVAKWEKSLHYKRRKTATNDQDKLVSMNLERQCDDDHDVFLGKMWTQIKHMVADHGLEMMSIMLNALSFHDMFFDHTFENVQGFMVLNLLLLILLVFKFGGSVFEPFTVIKMTFVNAAKDIGNFVISLFVIIFIFVRISFILIPILLSYLLLTLTPFPSQSKAGRRTHNVWCNVVSLQ
jgi:hypothetical protein